MLNTGSSTACAGDVRQVNGGGAERDRQSATADALGPATLDPASSLESQLPLMNRPRRLIGSHVVESPRDLGGFNLAHLILLSGHLKSRRSALQCNRRKFFH